MLTWEARASLSKKVHLCQYLNIQNLATGKLEGNSISGSEPADTEVKVEINLAGMLEVQESQVAKVDQWWGKR